jgi:hypothetical protein
MRRSFEMRWMFLVFTLSTALGCTHEPSARRVTRPVQIDLARADAGVQAEVVALPPRSAIPDKMGDGVDPMLTCVPATSPLAEKLTKEDGVPWQASDCNPGGKARRLILTPTTAPPLMCTLSTQQHAAAWAFLERNEGALGISSARGELFESWQHREVFLQRIPGTLIGSGESVELEYGPPCRLKRITMSLVAGLDRIAKQPTVSRKYAQDLARLQGPIYGVFPAKIQNLTTLAVVEGRLAWVVNIVSPSYENCGYPAATLTIDATAGTLISAKKSQVDGCRGAR